MAKKTMSMPDRKIKDGTPLDELIDTRDDRELWREELAEVRRACRHLDKAAELYGARRVEASLRTFDDHEGPIHLGFWRRWRAGVDRHLVPAGVIIAPWFGFDNVALRIALAPRVAA